MKWGTKFALMCIVAMIIVNVPYAFNLGITWATVPIAVMTLAAYHGLTCPYCSKRKAVQALERA